MSGGLCQPNAGLPSCPCVATYHGFDVGNADARGHLTVTIPDTTCDGGCDYGMGYGLGVCSSHDAGTAPYCNVPGAPAWCSMPWCYVNTSNCETANSWSSYANGTLHYSYSTCSAKDSFTDWYTARSGTIRLCSVFSAHAAELEEVIGGDEPRARPCGNSYTHQQVEAAVAALNRLNGGRGFALRSGLITRHYSFNYTYHTYPFGAWDTVGRDLSHALFGSDACDVVVGMANGCPDPEIIEQALVANATKRLYITGRGPQQVLTAAGRDQPYFFSVHVRSDEYAVPALAHYSRLGARSVVVLHEQSDNYFFTDLGRTTVAAAATLPDLHLRFNGTLPPRLADSALDVAALDALLATAHAARADALMLVMREPEFRHVVERLQQWRSGGPDARDDAPPHLYQALWWQGVPWVGADADADADGAMAACVGLAARCDYAVGGTQMSVEEAQTGHADALLPGTTYAAMQAAAGVAFETAAFVRWPDAAVIPSMMAQALRTVFRFRDLPDPSRPLSDALDYELVRAHLRSGDRVADTFYGPLLFNSVGQNIGKAPTSIQVFDGRAHVVLPTSAPFTSSRSFVYPAPATDCPVDARRIRFDEISCMLCAPSVCDTRSWWDLYGNLMSGGAAGLGAALIVCVLLCPALHARRRKLARQLLELQRNRLRYADHQLAQAVRLPEGYAYHLFLSYTWTTAADRTREHAGDRAS